MSFSKFSILFVFVSVLAFTVLVSCLAWRNHEQVPDALIVSVFAWFGLEGGALALLKVNQRKQASDAAALKKENASLKKQIAKIRKAAGGK